MSRLQSDEYNQFLSVGTNIVSAWVTSEGYSESQRLRLLKLLNSDFLLHLPVRPGLVKQKTPAGLRFLWHYHAAATLGWKSRRPEGHSRGFSEEINTFLRTKWFPDHTGTSDILGVVECRTRTSGGDGVWKLSREDRCVDGDTNKSRKCMGSPDRRRSSKE
ncbi:hypothetical protein M758_4G164800 [Ceratodon purpureus]|nr:hypothetical protein M758_4G164800 [Ceratodon purpureus]